MVKKQRVESSSLLNDNRYSHTIEFVLEWALAIVPIFFEIFKDPMTFFVRRCLQIFLVIETIIFVLLYCFGPKGLKSLYDIAWLRKKTEIEIAQLTQEIAVLQQQNIENKTEFAKEKIAREQLLMKKDHEIVYLKKIKD